MRVIDVKDFSFTYPNGKEVLHNLTFSLEKGQMLLLCGENGCGKSTLLRSLIESVAPKGKKSGFVRCSAESAILFQEADKNIIFTKVWDDLIFPACNKGLAEEEILKRAQEVLSLFHITALKDRTTASLSGGEKQLVALASIMMLEPELLILDEPLSQLDEQAKSTLLEAILRVKAAGTAIMIAEHNTDRLLEHCDKVLVFADDGARCFAKDNFGAMEQLPNSPEYILLERKLCLPIRTMTTREAVENLRKKREDIAVHPLPRTAATAQPVLQTKALSFSYEAQVPVLSGVNLTLNRGEIACLIGANGAGKSTLFHLICSFLKPEKGEIVTAENAAIGYLAQNPIYSFLKDTLEADYLYLLKKNKLPKERMQACFERFALFEDLKALLQTNPLDLSGGERAKAALFKLLLLNRSILLLDEPEKHLDKNSLKQLSNTLKSLSAQGITFFIISHSPDFVFRCAQRVFLLENGAVQAYDTDSFFPQKMQTSLYRAIQNAGLEVSDCDQAEVKNG